MTDLAVISEYTYRKIDAQRAAFPDMPYFVLPEDISALFRPTQRNDSLEIHVLSFGVLADREDLIRGFAAQCKKRHANISAKEEDCRWKWKDLPDSLVGLWRNARVKNSAKIGARVSADNKKQRAKDGIALIESDWQKPSREVPTKVLKERSGLSLNTIKKYLGPRSIAQYNYRLKNGRQIKQVETSEEPREEMDFCGVYVFQVQRGVYKVGSSNDATRRFKQVSQHHKKDMKVVELFNMDRTTAYAVEMEAHRLLRKTLAREYRGNEIFRASLETIKMAIRRAIRTVSEVPKYE